MTEIVIQSLVVSQIDGDEVIIVLRLLLSQPQLEYLMT